jgi:hypothetical protein
MAFVIRGIGANRYRDPDEDLPADFELKREGYYKALNLPLDADRFITELQTEMCEALNAFDGGLKKNRCVRIGPKGGGWITLTPLDAQPDPPNLTALKTELNAIWPMTSLLDMVKETDLRLGFTDVLKSPTAYEVLERSVLQPRLLLCLHGIGTNAGLQRMAGLESGVTAKDLAYVRRRYISSVDILRRAIAIVADGTLRARNPAIWGTATTACASDSKHFGAWDQNLTTQWHVRYGGRGIMIYWHVERNSLCIHSLGFQLLPRLKAIHSQKLHRPETGKADAYANLQLILSKADRLGAGAPTVRPDDQVHHGAAPGNGRNGSHPAALHQEKRATPNL